MTSQSFLNRRIIRSFGMLETRPFKYGMESILQFPHGIEIIRASMRLENRYSKLSARKTRGGV